MTLVKSTRDQESFRGWGDAKDGLEVTLAVRSLKMRPVRTSFESPWQ
jgi:hypothetical protein